jgi:hypothetical protein
MAMSKKGKRSLMIGLASTATLLLAQVASAHILVIGSKQSGVKHLSTREIAAIYMGMPSALNQQFKPYDQPAYSKVYREFCEKVLHKSPDQMSQYWASQTFRGLGSAPAKLASLDELFSLIASYPGVIGYVDSDQVPASYLKNVRIYYGGHHVHHAAKKAVVKKAVVKKAVVAKPAKKVVQQVAALPREQAPGLWGEVLENNHWGNFYQHAGVQTQINKFARDGDLQSRVNNATPFIHYVYSEAKKMGIPAQFALLPLMESNYNPQATNRNGAGLWQLERATAKYMGLRVDSHYDCRKDIVTSTRAALQHLLDEFNRFHNWQLAAAAYNCGTGPVEEAVKHNIREGKPTNFWAIRSQLPHITQAYVPRLVALSYMLNHASHYNINLPDLSTDATLQSVEIKQPLTIAQLSQLSGVSLTQLKQLNPGMVAGRTPGKHLCHLLLPISSVSDFNDNLASMNHQQSQRLAEKKAAVQAAEAKVLAEKKAAVQAAEAKALAEKKHQQQLAQQKREAAVAAEKAKQEKELAPYQVTHVKAKKKSSDDNLKSLLSKIYEH